MSDSQRAAGHLNQKVNWVTGCSGVDGVFGMSETWRSEDLAYQFNELIIKFKAKAKLW